MNLPAPQDGFTGDQICGSLRPGIKCFRVYKYHKDRFDLEFHQDVPSHRISIESSIEVLRALAGHFGGMPATFILGSRLNNRGRVPERYPSLRHDVTYPERGVMRHAVCADDAYAYLDLVVYSENFRKQIAITKWHPVLSLPPPPVPPQASIPCWPSAPLSLAHRAFTTASVCASTLMHLDLIQRAPHTAPAAVDDACQRTADEPP